MAPALPLEWVEPSDSFSLPLTVNTLKGFRDWAKSDAYPERGRVSFLNDEIFVDMSPERINSHSSLKSHILYALMQYSLESNRGIAWGDGLLVTNETAGVSNEPDATFVLFESLESGKVKLHPAQDEQDYNEVVGSPDLLVEAISPSSIRKDTVKLKTLYHAAGVAEYWIVDAMVSAVELQLWKWTPLGYDAAAVIDGWVHSAVLDRDLRIVREVLRWGLHRYRVELRIPPDLNAP